MGQEYANALLLGETEQGWSQIAWHLEHRGCHCWFAKSTEEALVRLGEQKFQLVLSTKPLPLTAALVARLAELSCSVFYRHPAGDGCWWLPVVNRGKDCLGVTALRPNEFVARLDRLVQDIEAVAAA